MSFAPVYNEHSRALILGTWPSPKSREVAFYYGHPQNRFWPMLAALTGEPVPAREDIEAKKQIILRHGLALWDTLESCTITGASDASIRDVVPNDIAGLLAKAPIEAVFCNGATAYKIYTKYLEPVSGIPAVSCTSGCWAAGAGSGFFSSAASGVGSSVRVGTAGASRSKFRVLLSAIVDSILSN